MSRAGRVSAAGVAAAIVLLIALGIYLPLLFERQALESRLDAASSLVRVLEAHGLVPEIGDHLRGAEFDRFDESVKGGLLGGENVRVKLWNPSGEIVYSDEERQVGRRFAPSQSLHSALGGRSSAFVTDLSEGEHALDQGLVDRAIAMYVPVRRDGAVIGAFEIHQDYEPLARHLAHGRASVWVSVGGGLAALTIFVTSMFRSTARVMDRERRVAEQRADDLATLLTTARGLAGEPSLERTGRKALAALADRLGLHWAGVVVGGKLIAHDSPDGEETCSVAMQVAERAAAERSVHGASVSEAQLETKERCVAFAVPFRNAANTSAVLVVCRDSPPAFSVQEVDLLRGVAGQMAIAAENGQLFEDLRRMTESRGDLLGRLVRAQENERRRLVGDLHDGLGQALTRILYGLRGIRARLSGRDGEIEQELVRLEALADQQTVSLRSYMATIRPALLEDFGLLTALDAFARDQQADGGPRVEIISSGSLPELDPAVSVTLFRAAQEAILNSRRHAAASGVRLELRRENGEIALASTDDGVGAGSIKEGIGLSSMRDRVESLGGHLDVRSSPGKGTSVSVRIPVGASHGKDPRDNGR